ncbi:MAG TPA: hypothetical protein VIL52_04305, partial [Bacteroidota bacterium]
MSQFLVDIALPVPIDHPFTYIVPPELQPYAKPGMRTVVPFGRKSLTGVIVGIQTKPPARGLKPIRDILDVTPSFSDDMLKLTKWIAEYYFATWGETLKAAAPQGFLAQGKRNARLATQEVEQLLTITKRSAPKQFAVLLALQKNGTMAVSRLQTVTKTKSLFAILNDMAQKGWIEVFEDTQTSKAKPKLEKIVSLTDVGRSLENGPKKLSVKQSAVLQALRNLEDNSMPVQRLLKEAATSLSILKTLEKH